MNTNCKSCNSCKFCDYCDYCDSCDSCYFCNSCDYCDYCYSCKSCENLVNGFMCINLKLKKKNKKKYWIFNKEVTKKEWDKRYEIGVKK